MTNHTSNRFEKFEIILGRIFLSLIIFLSLFLLIDHFSVQYLSRKNPLTREFTEAHYLKPYVTFSGHPNKDGYNRLGYLGDEPIMPKPPGEFRIFMLGGSVLLWSKPTVPELLEQKFRQHGQHQVKVYNFGVVSAVSTQNLVRLLLEVTELQPDLIVFLNGGNDIISPLTSDPRPGYPYDFLVLENNPLFESNVGAYPKWDLLAYGSNILRFSMNKYFTDRFGSLEKLRTEAGYGSKKWQKEIATIYLKNMWKAQVVSKAFGADFMVFFQPLVYFKQTLSPEEKKMLHFIKLRRPAVTAIKDSITAGVQAFNNKVNFIDLSNLFAHSPETVFFDDIHLVNDKYDVVAEAIYEGIIKEERLRSYKNTDNN